MFLSKGFGPPFSSSSNPVSTTKATVVTWLLLNVYFALQCPTLNEIRSEYMGKFIAACPNIEKYKLDQQLLFLALLDPYSPYLPEDIRETWKNKELAYQLSRNYFYDMHKKREKIMETSTNKQNEPETEDITQIIINVYQNI